MGYQPGDRIFGIETEFGCLVSEELGLSSESVVEQIKDYIFYDLKLGALDMHSRDEVFEPAMCGGFLLNGGRLYIDAVGSHLEYATAECRDLADVVANDRAGQRQIVRAIRELGYQDSVTVYNNSVDHFGGHTFGCHENYLVRMTEDFFSAQAPLLYPFLVTRQIFAGVGRVGGHVLVAGVPPDPEEVAANPIDYIWVSQIYNVYEDPTVTFQLSQRSDHILKTIASRVRFNRALINPKWEHFYAHDGMHRLHILFGESNQSEYAYALKVGTTNLVLRLLEDGLLTTVTQLRRPLHALRDISRDQTYTWQIAKEGGESTTALEIQHEHLALAERYAGTSPDVDWTLREWRRCLEDLASDPLGMYDRLDWVAKRRVVDMYRQEMGLEWGDDALHSVDLEYHNIDPDRSLFHALQADGSVQRTLDELDILDAMTDPPQNTRALGRAKLVSQVLSRSGPRYYIFDWSGVALDRTTYVEMPDPFETYEQADVV